MKLIPIPKDKYYDYRLDAMFGCYKWDPQFYDNNTLAKHVLVISEEEHKELKALTEKLDKETIEAEEFLNNNLKLAKPLALPRQTQHELYRMKNYQADRHIRLSRYDFHPTIEGGWAVSELNSDVPGGFAETSLLPQLAADLLDSKNYWYINFGEMLVDAIAKKVKPQGRIMIVHCTSYSDDRQHMQFLGDRLSERGFAVIYAAADHLRFKDNKAYSILDGNEGEVDAIFRFTPLEWLIGIKPKRWQGYFDTTTPSCNHPVAMFAQTKRFPLAFDALEKHGVQMTAWRELLPETLKVKDAKGKEGFIYKPACGRVGENIAIKEACRGDEYKKIMRDVKRHPRQYLAQKMFVSKPLAGEGGTSFHVCLGTFVVEGKLAGYYARISDKPRIDSYAADTPVLICRGGLVSAR
ncbi:MAG: glutathionylspermidine synthase family protein [Lachnospiraceae bacterium]|jgi:glutathionylspermidine synthase|nr:glutathionylspermidine synthase family protein [Lachnospiraceae bacterium]